MVHSTFWLVWSPDNDLDIVNERFDSLTAAKEEALALCDQYGVDVFVLKSVGGYARITPCWEALGEGG